jgi:2-isopropylmalate synthase
VANSLTAILNGARHVECTINGIGERAGNASLEEIVMALRTRNDVFAIDTGLRSDEIVRTSRLLSRITGVDVQPNKAVVGDNALAHEASIHQDGVLKGKLTYEIMRLEDIGRPSNKLVLGKHSGRYALAARFNDLGVDVAGRDLDVAFKKFKELADRKKEVDDEDLLALVTDGASHVFDTYEPVYLHVISGTGVIHSATVRLRQHGRVLQGASVGDGSVHAALVAIDGVTGTKGRLIDYVVRAATPGKDAIGEVVVKVDFDGTVVSGRGVSTDVIEASVRAYLNALNRLLHGRAQAIKDVGSGLPSVSTS